MSSCLAETNRRDRHWLCERLRSLATSIEAGRCIPINRTISVSQASNMQTTAMYNSPILLLLSLAALRHSAVGEVVTDFVSFLSNSKVADNAGSRDPSRQFLCPVLTLSYTFALWGGQTLWRWQKLPLQLRQNESRWWTLMPK